METILKSDIIYTMGRMRIMGIETSLLILRQLKFTLNDS